MTDRDHEREITGREGEKDSECKVPRILTPPFLLPSLFVFSDGPRWT